MWASSVWRGNCFSAVRSSAKRDSVKVAFWIGAAMSAKNNSRMEDLELFLDKLGWLVVVAWTVNR